MRSNYRPVGDYIKKLNERNKDGSIKKLLGVNLDKKFIPSVANIVGTDLTKYKVIKRGQFGCKLMSVGRDKRLPISRLTDYSKAIISSAYFVFEVIDENVLNPEYLMMWFLRSESDRYLWFQSGGDIRGRITWEEFCTLPIKLPSIEKQRKIIQEYNVVKDRIKLNEQLNQKLEATAQALYKHWFVDFEFPVTKESHPEIVSGSQIAGYKSAGGKMVFNEELDKEIPDKWAPSILNNIANYSDQRVKIKDLDLYSYISTENMLANRKGVVEASNLPTSNTVNGFKVGDVLISNIRPYFKKIWRAQFNGGCSNDILCFAPNKKEEEIYLYYLTEQDIFFEYVMAGSKGTKMPRGDKEWIMNYVLAKPPIELINYFTDNVGLILKRIRTNILQNKILSQTQALLLSKMATVEEEKVLA